MPTLENDKVARINYKLTDDAGKVVNSSEGRDPLEYLHGHGNIVAGLEKALAGKSEGDSVKVSVSPEEGYGVADEALVIDVLRDNLPVEEIETGMRFTAETSGGPRMFTVLEVGEDSVKLDGNHPLAGENLHFEVDVVSVRDAEPDELSHGHVHSGCCGGGGHSHGDDEHKHGDSEGGCCGGGGGESGEGCCSH